MKRLCKEYITSLSTADAPSEKFRAPEKRIREDKKNSRVCADMRRSEMIAILFMMLKEGSITRADLSKSNLDLQGTMDFLYNR